MKNQFKFVTLIMICATLALTSCDKEGGDNNSLLLLLLDGGTNVDFLDAPGPARVWAGDTSLSLAWQWVYGATAFEVWYSKTNDPTSAMQDGGDIVIPKHVIKGLTEGTTYYVWLKAKNPAGTSDFGQVASSITGLITVTYHVGTGNTEGTVPVDSNEYKRNDLVTVLDNTGNLNGAVIRDGIKQRVVQWNTRIDGTGTAYEAGDTFIITQDTILHAIYTTGTDVLRKAGPAGGWVFYDAGSAQTWGRYLEAANVDLTDSVWGTYNFTVSGSDGYEIGTGAQNTQDIVDNDTGTLNKAADGCFDYSVVYGSETFDDWFLPSKNELDAMYDNLKKYGVGGFADDYYWSSYENGNFEALSQDFGSNTMYQLFANKNSLRRVRAIRAFVSGSPDAGIYMVTYNVGTDNTAGTVPVDSSVYEKNDLVTVLDNTGELVGAEIRDGIKQRFVEWNTQADGAGTAYEAGNTFTITGDTTLYAIYTTGTDVLRKVGPAGGWVFYDAGSAQAWGRYLEAANVDGIGYVWGTLNYKVSRADGTAIGTGERNTESIVFYDRVTIINAAHECYDYGLVYGGKTYGDWFLPSKDELNVLYANLKVYGVGGFDFVGFCGYWSSSEESASGAWGQDFDTGLQNYAVKNNMGRFRAVRAFF